MKSVMGASKALEELIKLMPKEAHKIDASGNNVEVSAENLHPGDQIFVKSGEKIPLDGSIFEEDYAVDESMLMGESLPVERKTGMEAIGGSVNGHGVLKINVSKTGNDTYLSQVIQLVGATAIGAVIMPQSTIICAIITQLFKSDLNLT